MGSSDYTVSEESTVYKKGAYLQSVAGGTLSPMNTDCKYHTVCKKQSINNKVIDHWL